MKKSALKIFTPGEVPIAEEVPKEEAVSKVIPPTPEQIIAIKVFLLKQYYKFCLYTKGAFNMQRIFYWL